MKYHLEPEFQCNYDKRTEKQQLFHNKTSLCFSVSDKAPSNKHIFKNLRFLTCPCNYEDSNVLKLLDLEELYNKFGITPKNTYMNQVSRDITDCPAKLVQAFKIIRNFLNEKENAEIKKQNDNMRNKMK